MSSTSLSDLPEEMLRRILRMLPPDGLKTVMLVCKQWKIMVDDPKLWTWSVVSVSSRCDLQKLQIHRLQLIETIMLSPPALDNIINGNWNQPGELENLLQVVMNNPSISKVYGIEKIDLGSVEPSLLGSALSKLDVLKPLHLSNISTSQYVHIFSAIAQKESPMKELTVAGFSMTEVSPTLFPSAVSNVKELKLTCCSTGQMLALLQEIVEKERPLISLHLSCCHMNYIDTDLADKALNKLESVTFASCAPGWVSHELATAILRGVLQEGSKLKKLMLKDISSSYARELDEELLRKTAKKIGQFWSKKRRVVDAYQREFRRLGAISIFD